MEEPTWGYEKMGEDLEIKYCPSNDYDGSITGHIVFGVKAWFDENPTERIARGWVKHIYHDTKSIDYDRQRQYLVRSTRQIDEYTIEDVYHVMDKSEEMMLLEELTGSGDARRGGVTFIVNGVVEGEL